MGTNSPSNSRHLRPNKAAGWIAGPLFTAQGLCAVLAATPSSSRWIAADEQVVHDTLTRLEWTRADNGYDIDWTHAKEFCNHLPGPWRLPTIEELAALYERSKAT